ncbi:MAG: FHA domain-containing protein [Desulfotomaculaceae bacterium]|nr:FHA domain-containing protein [Desulfotomaculaceae bacterium]
MTDKEVSRTHCELSLQRGFINIVDLGSQNGTMVNGVPIIGHYQLQNDDIILVGRTELRLTIL